MRGGRMNPKTRDQVAEVRPKLFLLLQEKGKLSTLEIAKILGINTMTLGTVLRHSQMTFDVKDIQENNLKLRMISLKSASACSVV